MKRLAILGTFAVLFAHFAPTSASSDDFYKTKTVSIYSGYPSGGANDIEVRMVAQHMRNFIPGTPTILPRNMPGAAGMTLSNYLYSVAAPDGLTIGMPGRSGFLLTAMVGDPNVRYDLAKFTWIGTAAPVNLTLWMRKGAGIRNWDELKSSTKEIVIGGLTAGSSTTVTPLLLAKYQGLKLRVISGYPGSSEAALAMERGEIDGTISQAASMPQTLLANGEIIPIVAFFEGEGGVPGLETVIEHPRLKVLFSLLSAPSRVGLPLVGPPALPSDAVKALRAAYGAMMNDADYRAEAIKRGFAVGKPMVGEELQSYVERNMTGIPKDVIDEYLTYSESAR